MSNFHNQINAEWVVSGQNLRSGEVVYLASSGWVSKLASAQIFDDEGVLASNIGLIKLNDQTVLFPDKLRISRAADGAAFPVQLREVFRATGPSNRFHGKQAETEQAHHV